MRRSRPPAAPVALAVLAASMLPPSIEAAGPGPSAVEAVENAGAAPTAAPSDPPGMPRLVDVAAERGLRFVHDLGRERIVHAVETTGSGACVLDLDDDGDDDLFLVQGAVMEIQADPALAPAPPRRRQPSRLFRNEGGRFVDATEEAGLAGPAALWGMGCAVADVDGDGDDDLLETGYGADRLLLNEGGRFRDVATIAGVADPRWTTSAGFADFDSDSDLDLYVGAYVDFRPDGRRCVAHDLDVTCGPRDYDGIRGRLWRNDGVGEDGVPRFTDVTDAVGAVEPSGKTLGVLFEDLTGDGRADLYLANDTERNTLLVNTVGEDGAVRFRDLTILAGVGFSDVGLAEAGMGVDAGDFDRRLPTTPDLVVTNFHLETNTLYASRAPSRWADVSDRSGLGAASLRRLAFGVNAADLDLDGDLDLFVANGHVEPRVAEFDPSTTHAQVDQVLLNESGDSAVRLRDVADAVEAATAVSRASALLDLEGDGDVDVVVSTNGGPAQLLENRTSRAGRRFLMLRLEAPPPNTDAVGARVEVRPAGEEGPVQVRRVRTASSFLAASTRRLHVGLGAARAADVVVSWPDGATSRHEGLATDARHVLRHPSSAGEPESGDAP